MRSAFVKKLIELANKYNDLYLITADTGFRVLDEFKDLFPDRYLNIGISEANMIGVAAGLTLSGKIVFVYGIVPFVTMRCFEQIRIDLCYQNLPVKLIGIGQGLTYGSAGATHQSIEDIAIMNCLPNMTIVCPGDPVETEKAVESSIEVKGPLYLRLGKSGEKIIHSAQLSAFKIGKGIRLYGGKDIAIIATGNMLETAVNVYEILKQKNIFAELISMHTIKPLDVDLIVEISKRCKIIVSIEEHNFIGGLGSRIADVITDKKLAVNLKKFALPDKYVVVVGEQDYLRDYYGLTAEKIGEAILCDYCSKMPNNK